MRLRACPSQYLLNHLLLSSTKIKIGAGVGTGSCWCGEDSDVILQTVSSVILMRGLTVPDINLSWSIDTHFYTYFLRGRWTWTFNRKLQRTFWTVLYKEVAQIMKFCDGRAERWWWDRRGIEDLFHFLFYKMLMIIMVSYEGCYKDQMKQFM